MKWIDAHCHLAKSEWGEHLPALLDEARAGGVHAWIQGGISPDDWRRQLKLHAKDPGIYPVFGLHPWHVITAAEPALDAELTELRHFLPQAQALGELGLDFWRSPDTKEKQAKYFLAQVRLAREFEKPMVFHFVRAHGEALALLKAEAPHPYSGLVHSFYGSEEEMNQYLKLGFLLSVGPGVFRKSAKFAQAVRALPDDRLLIETDAPDQKPKLAVLEGDAFNRPQNLLLVAEEVGKMRGQSAETVLNNSTRNLKTLLRL